ncbi:TPA: sugar transferase [Streptococcus suis]
MYPVIKRILAVVISGTAIICLSPIFIFVALAIKLDSKGPVLFKQKRVGKNKSHFMIYKFRSMYVDAPSDMPTHLLKDPNAMITKVGGFLRKTSLDELPQLFNILKGEMAIVGPRPALWNQYDLIEERDKYGANDIRPGLTGWAQINGRDELEIDEKSKLDGFYVQHMSFALDVKCFFGTFLSVAKSEGVVEGGTGQKKESWFKDV